MLLDAKVAVSQSFRGTPPLQLAESDHSVLPPPIHVAAESGEMPMAARQIIVNKRCVIVVVIVLKGVRYKWNPSIAGRRNVNRSLIIIVLFADQG